MHTTSPPAWDMRAATTVGKGHGRVEVRHLIASTALNDYLDWPGLAQVIMIERVFMSVYTLGVRFGSATRPEMLDLSKLGADSPMRSIVALRTLPKG